MTFTNETDLQNFLSDKPFYRNNDCYCLGNTLEDAGAIVRKILVASKGQERATKYVGMDTGNSKQRS